MEPYRGEFGASRPAALAELALPPRPMPAHHGGRPLKAWRFIGIFAPEMMLALAQVRVGRAHQAFWAAWDRAERRLHQRTAIGFGPVRLATGRAQVRDPGVRIAISLDETAGIETICPSGQSYAWTRKQAPVRATVRAELDGREWRFEARAVIDDTAAYYPRHTHWRWSAGVGRTDDGRDAAWNLVSGVNDPPLHSERTVWQGGDAREAPPCVFADDLSRVDGLTFEPEAVLERRQNLLVLRSRYRLPFGRFSGRLPGGTALTEGYGVMEEHEARW